MNVDLSAKEIESLLARLKRGEQSQDEELLVYKLRRYSETRENFMRQYQQDFKIETKLPPPPNVVEGVPMPQDSPAQETSPTFGETSA